MYFPLSRRSKYRIARVITHRHVILTQQSNYQFSSILTQPSQDDGEQDSKIPQTLVSGVSTRVLFLRF